MVRCMAAARRDAGHVAVVMEELSISICLSCIFLGFGNKVLG
jgi:hypothetical protein